MALTSGNTFSQGQWEVGGGIPVFANAPEVLTVGGNIQIGDLPSVGNALPPATPVFFADGDDTRPTAIMYVFGVAEAVGATDTSIKISKSVEGTRAKVGMFIMKEPATLTTKGKSVTITAIDSSNVSYDTLTISEAIGALSVGDCLFEADKLDATTAGLKVTKVNALLRAHIWNANGVIKGTTTLAYMGLVYENRVPPIPEIVKKSLSENQCYFRFTKAKQ